MYCVDDIKLNFGIYPKADHSLPAKVMGRYAFAALESLRNVYGKNIAFFDEEMKEKQKSFHLSGKKKQRSPRPSMT